MGVMSKTQARNKLRIREIRFDMFNPPAEFDIRLWIRNNVGKNTPANVLQDEKRNNYPLLGVTIIYANCYTDLNPYFGPFDCESGYEVAAINLMSFNFKPSPRLANLQLA
jgi:hypothetical protein